MDFSEKALRKKYLKHGLFEDEECLWLAYYESLRSRSDGDHPAGSDPLVGAVIRDSDKYILGISHRAIGQEGEHAEKSLLTGQLSGRDLTGCTLYTTLEPCIPEVRKETSCAELIAKSPIRRVFIGILDPNPQVYSKGLSYLFNKGVEIHPFPSEIMKLIYESCPVFKKVERGRERDIQRLVALFQEEFDQGALEYFFGHCGGVFPNRESFAEYLLNRNYVTFEGRKEKVDDQVKLMFYPAAKQPTSNAKIFFINNQITDGKEEKPIEFDGPIALALEQMTAFVSRFGISQGTVAYGLIKEAFVNAILHREYFKSSSYVYVIYDGVSFSVRNPVSMAFSDAKIKEIMAFQTKPEPGNPILVELAHQVHFIDVQGKGLLTLKAAVPLPSFQLDADRILTLTLKIV